MKQKPSPFIVHISSTNLNKTYLQKFFAGAWMYGMMMGMGCGLVERLMDKYRVKEIEVRN